ncbi:porin [Trinickia dinghuensis]|uniref:Porin n=1 Tax=Trinickia dinghuensis TaxID=2291023 RepID=A0A3D8K604_9BURK|nr:porin [Trinickia dinghuensis]RDV00739.1 porin [Trinickia dinghuensis]
MKALKVFVPAVLAAAACVAQAQSSVTLYGTIDEGFDYIRNVNGHSDYTLTSGTQQLGDRWGLKGSEDLGNGLHAVFQLENGFALNTGAALPNGQMFGRQAYVGLSSEETGTVTLGRQYDSVVDYVAPLAAAGSWGGTLFAHPFDADNLDDSFRVNNAIKYTSANYAGLQLGGVYGFSNQAGSFASNRVWSAGARYQAGALTAAAAYMDIDGADETTGGAVTDAPYISSRQRIAAAGVNYAIGATKFGLVYTHSDIYGRPDLPAQQSLKFDNIEANAKWDVSSALYLAAMYLYTRESIATTTAHYFPHRNEFGLTAGYHLSKRTEVYAQGLYEHATGSTVLGQIGDTAASSSHDETVARVGIRTAF